MLKILKARINQGYQTIPDINRAKIDEKFQGLPSVSSGTCKDCSFCEKICPTDAIKINPLSIDLGKCIFCGDCQRICPQGLIKFNNFYKLASVSRNALIVDSLTSEKKYADLGMASNECIKKNFGRSLKLRQVCCGGCNGCELELSACSNVNFDMGRFGIEFTASPRHADGIVITGPLTENMAKALEDTYLSIPEPKIIIACGACAISAGVFNKSEALNRDFFDKHSVDLYIPGCPPHPLIVIDGLLKILGRI